MKNFNNKKISYIENEEQIELKGRPIALKRSLKILFRMV